MSKKSLNSNRLVTLLQLSIFYFAAFSAQPLFAVTDTINQQLMGFLSSKDFDGVRSALLDGANPNTLDANNETSALCEAIDFRGTLFVELLLDHGASVNANTHSGRYKTRTALGCAIDHYNPQAFKLLLAKGAKPNVNLCLECDSKFRHTVLTEAMTAGIYPFVLEVVHRYSPGDLEMQAIIVLLEQTPADESHPWNDEREELISWVKNQGISINAQPASPLPPGIHSISMCFLCTRHGRNENRRFNLRVNLQYHLLTKRICEELVIDST